MPQTLTPATSQLLFILKKVPVKHRGFFVSLLLALLAAGSEAVSVVFSFFFIQGVLNNGAIEFGQNAFVQKFIQLEMWKEFLATNQTLWIGIAVIFFQGTTVLISYFSVLLFTKWEHSFSDNLRQAIWKRLMIFGKLYFDKTNVGTLASVLYGNASSLSYLFSNIREFFFWSAMVSVYLGTMLFFSWKLALAVFSLAPLLYFSQSWLTKKIKASSKDLTRVRGEFAKYFQSMSLCRALIVANGAEETATKNFAQKSSLLSAFEVSVSKKNLLIYPLQQLALLTVIAGLMIYLSVQLIGQGGSEVATLIVFLYAAKRASTGFNVITGLKSRLSGASGILEEIVTIFSDEGKYIVVDGTKKFDLLSTSIEFHDVSFSYDEKRRVLNKINLTFELGKTTAIVGSTGAGKSTIANLLLRFYACNDGEITANQIDIAEYDLSLWRKSISYISQEPWLFHDTLRSNLIFGLTTPHSDEKILETLKKVQLFELISKLPQGLDTEIGDIGIGLSGGEKQRLMIARAFLRDAQIILLDEATSALDSVTEQAVQSSMNELIKGKTAIVIAHRLSTIKSADKIIVLENGTIVEQGLLSELLLKKGTFWRYWEQQQLVGTNL